MVNNSCAHRPISSKHMSFGILSKGVINQIRSKLHCSHLRGYSFLLIKEEDNVVVGLKWTFLALCGPTSLQIVNMRLR